MSPPGRPKGEYRSAQREGTPVSAAPASHALPSQAAFAAALLAPDQACPRGLRAWNGSDPAARLAVYRNNVVGSLVDALAETFPVVQALVGAAFFRAMVAEFVRRAPPRSRILAHYGEALPAFIEGFEPARSLPYLADMARLELACVRAFHATDADPVADEAVTRALASGERIGDLHLGLHPSLTLLGSAWAVASLWAAHQGEGEPAPVAIDDAESALVVRRGFDVVVVRLPPGGAEFVAALQRGENLGAAAAEALQATHAFELSGTLALLRRHGALTTIDLPEMP
jgi:hypothetical protein